MQRPTRIMVFGILCLIVGVFSGLQNLSLVSAAAMGPAAVEIPDVAGAGLMGEMLADSARATKAALGKPVYRIASGVEAVVGCVLAVALFAAGIGLLRDRLWSVRITKVWAYYALVASVITVVLQSRYVMPEMSSAVEGSQMAGVVCMLPLLWLFPVLLLTVLPRPIVMDYLRWRAGTGAARTAPSLVEIEPAIARRPGVSHDGTHQQTPASQPDQPSRPSPPPASRPDDDTWRDDPWNDPNSR